MFMLQVTVGAMTFNGKCNRGIRGKIPSVVLSLDQEDSQQAIVDKGREVLFTGWEDKTFYLGNSDGHKIDVTSDQSIADYFKLHGLYPSKTRFYCVEVSQLYLSCRFVTVSMFLCMVQDGTVQSPISYAEQQEI